MKCDVAVTPLAFMHSLLCLCAHLVAPAIADVLKRPVAFAEDCIGKEATAAVAAMNPGDIVCLENTRFHLGEEENDPDFVAKLAALGDIFVNDACPKWESKMTLPPLSTNSPPRIIQKRIAEIDRTLGKRPVNV
jgi:hypothetical protein